MTCTSVLIATDNSTTVSAINKKGSRSPQIQEISEQLFHLAESKEILLSAVHIQGHLNVVVDALSKASPVPTEWTIPQREFKRLEDWHRSLLQIDLFASPLNHKIPTFTTTLNHPRATVVNAFTEDWNLWGQVYLFPPVNLLPKVVQRLRHNTGHGLLIVPHLPSAEWFPSSRGSVGSYLYAYSLTK